MARRDRLLCLMALAAWTATIDGQVAEPREPPKPPPNSEPTKPVIDVISPKDGDSVKGVMDVRIRVPGRRLKTYKAIWYNGPGQPGVAMKDDDDENAKYASIDFSSWKWQGENNRYPLRFRATDSNGVVIASVGITVVVVK